MVKPKIHPHLPEAKRGYELKRNKPQKGTKRNAEVKGLSAMTCMGYPTILINSQTRKFINKKNRQLIKSKTYEPTRPSTRQLVNLPTRRLEGVSTFQHNF